MDTIQDKREKRKKNKFILDREKVEKNELEKKSKNNDIYPSLNDPNFALKIASKKEFNDSKINTKILTDIREFKEMANNICFKDYEIAQHQKFVKNFISFQTPYNSLLLYHGLGSGKTCSAIGVSEQMRKYMTQMNNSKRIIIVASPNVQKNFKLQLFDENKLKENNGIFTLNNCTGDKILKEINPTNSKGFTRDEIVKSINSLIQKKYVFMGYTQFSNYIDKKLDSVKKSKNIEKATIKILKSTFDNRLLIIDEVHNIRLSNDNKLKKISSNLFKIATHSENFKMLLLSATPLYNNYKEIIWLLNLMNVNDGRGLIYKNEIFDDDGNFLLDDEGDEIGKKMLMHKANGYISYIRGENPYSFPFRIFPMNFDLSKSTKNTDFVYPTQVINGKRLTNSIEHVDVYLTEMGEYQEQIYNKVIEPLSTSDNDDYESNDMDTFGYTKLTDPIEALNITYPQIEEIDTLDIKSSIGSKGLNNVFTYKEVNSAKSYITDFEYKKPIYEKYGRIFSESEIGKYSGKIKSICDKVRTSNGICLIYSQYIDAGVIPMALALEEMGFVRHGESKNLFNDDYRKKHRISRIDAITNKSEKEMKGKTFTPSKYMMITGKSSLSSNWLDDFKVITDEPNKNGENIKVVIITRTGSEGLDFTNIRNVHILDPWYNMNRLEQIIGRAIRFCSHKYLSFEHRNCCIYLYGSIGKNKEKESADLYVYRLAEKKSMKIGNVTRVLKEVAVDCVLNISQTNFSFSNMDGLKIDQMLYDGKAISLEVGDKPYSSMCDYKETCEYKCNNIFKDKIGDLGDVDEVNYSTYNEEFISANTSLIIQKIKMMFSQKYFYRKSDLISEIKAVTKYSLDEILYALDEIISDGNDIFVDKYKRLGKLVNVADIYMFQPLELLNSQVSMFDRETPVDVKHYDIKIVQDTDNDTQKKEDTGLIDNNIYNTLSSEYTRIYDYKNNETSYSFAMTELLDVFEVDSQIVKEILIEHLLDNLSVSDKTNLLDYIYNLKDITHELEKLIKDYFDKKKVSNTILTGYLLCSEKGYVIYLMKTDQKKKYFIKAKQGEINNLLTSIKDTFLFTLDEINNNFGSKIGVLLNVKNKSLERNELLFKIKDTKQERTTGARCDQYTKTDKLKLLNELVSNIDKVIVNYTGSNMKKIPIDTCYFIELLFRYMDFKKIDGKKWFLDAEQSVLNKLERRIKL
jgi:superfamily II DNA or RNA helicase